MICRTRGQTWQSEDQDGHRRQASSQGRIFSLNTAGRIPPRKDGFCSDWLNCRYSASRSSREAHFLAVSKSRRTTLSPCTKKLCLLISPCLMPNECSLFRTPWHAARSSSPAVLALSMYSRTKPMTRPSSVRWAKNCGAMPDPSIH